MSLTGQRVLDLGRARRTVQRVGKRRVFGRVSKVVGMLVEGELPGVKVGGLCELVRQDGSPPVPAEVVGVRGKTALAMPVGDVQGVSAGDIIRPARQTATVPVGPGLLGRVVDGLARPLDGLGPLLVDGERPLYTAACNPLERTPIEEPLDLGVRAINGLITVGKGQRIGVMAGSGVGKSVLMGMMTRQTRADVNVVALIGERGREVSDFLHHQLGPAAMQRSVLVSVTSDRSPVERMRGAFVATTIAEYFAQRGNDVLLLMDSVTRVAMAQREIGLAAGEPPATKGYPPSVFALMPRLLERAGNFGDGSITGIYTVLAEGDDIQDPIADNARAILDGHIVLSRRMAAGGHYPAIDVNESLSRVMPSVVDESQVRAAARLRELLATWRDNEDLINIGAYAPGNNPRLDDAIARIEAVRSYLRQDVQEAADMQASRDALLGLFADSPPATAPGVSP